jgi:hypothetical protein
MVFINIMWRIQILGFDFKTSFKTTEIKFLITSNSIVAFQEIGLSAWIPESSTIANACPAGAPLHE